MQKNILLVQVVDSYGPNKFLPLAVAYQWLNACTDEYVKDNYKLLDVLIEKTNIYKYVEELEKPDVVLMSCYVWNWNYNCELAKLIKKKYPDCFIIIGGPQVSKTDFLLLKKHNYFDLAVLGENEESLKKVLINLDSKNFTDIPGLMIPGKIDNRIERTLNLDILPSPILSGFYDMIIDKYEKKYNKKFMWQVTFETMRGCPYHCAFCDIGESYWNKAYLFNIERVKKEIDWMSERKIEYVSVCDSNWGMFERDLEITEYVIKKKLETGYPNIWDVTWAKNNQERIKKIATVDKENDTKLFKGITFALQSLNEKSLKSIDRFNLGEDIVRESMEYYKNLDIPTYSELIWPLPSETLDSLKENIQKLIDLGQRDFLMVHPLVLTPNSPMGQPEYIEKYKLKYENVPLDTFWLKVEDPETYINEDVYAVYATDTVDLDITVQGHMFAHWMIVLFYYGWAHYLMQYMRSKYNITESEFITAFIKYIEDKKPQLLYEEHSNTVDGLYSVFQKATFWGTLINDIYWEYKSATSVKFHHNRDKLKNELEGFMKYVYNIDSQKLIDLNSDMVFDYRKSYPYLLSIDKDTSKHCLGIDSTEVVIDHYDKNNIDDDDLFVKKAYHWQRKNRYWKCSLSKT
jgi:putative methyltransferase